MMAVAAACGAVVALAWAVATAARAAKLRAMLARRAAARLTLASFADRFLELSSVDEILDGAAQMARQMFAIDRVVTLVPGDSEDEAWVASSPGLGAMPAPPPGFGALLSWFKHNPLIAVRSELADRRFGAMRGPLRDVMNGYQVDVVLPLVDRERVLAILCIRLGRRSDALDQELLRLLRLEAAAACANVSLHHRAAHMVSLAREVDLASSVELAMVPPELEGQVGRLAWAGHYAAAGRAGSDFFGVYPLAGGRVMIVIGDAVGRDLAGTMVSAVVKSCCDVIFERRPEEIDPAQLLGLLNGSLYRPSRPALTSCFAALFDPTRSTVFYANAGHVAPYRLGERGDDIEVSSLNGSGPLLGDEPSPDFHVRSAPLALGDTFFLLTDGLIKARDQIGHVFGDRRLQRALQAVDDTAPERVRLHVTGELRRFRGATAHVDDEAFLAIRLE